MKRYCKGMTIGKEHVRAAYERWTRSASGRKNRPYIDDPAALVAEIAEEIRGRCLRTRPITVRERIEPTNGKVRAIGVQTVKQQVLDYVAIDALMPLLSAKIGYYQCASMPGRGQVFAMRAMRKWMRDGGYFVKLDVRKCYQSIDLDRLIDVFLAPYVASDDVLYLVGYLLSTYEHGLNIGSYLSMYLATYLMSFAYHYAEDVLWKGRRGVRKRLISHQLHYMDDVLLMGPDKRDLRCATRMMVRYFSDELGLDIKPWKICRVGSEPLDMCGYVMRPERTTVRAGTFKRAKRAIARMHKRPGLRRAYRVISYYGFFANSDSARFLERSNAREAVKAAKETISKHDRRKSNEKS